MLCYTIFHSKHTTHNTHHTYTPHTRIHRHTYIHHIHTYIHTCAHTHIHTHMYTYTHVHTPHTHIHTHTHVHIHTHTYIHTLPDGLQTLPGDGTPKLHLTAIIRSRNQKPPKLCPATKCIAITLPPTTPNSIFQVTNPPLLYHSALEYCTPCYSKTCLSSHIHAPVFAMMMKPHSHQPPPPHRTYEESRFV